MRVDATTDKTTITDTIAGRDGVDSLIRVEMATFKDQSINLQH